MKIKFHYLLFSLQACASQQTTPSLSNPSARNWRRKNPIWRWSFWRSVSKASAIPTSRWSICVWNTSPPGCLTSQGSTNRPTGRQAHKCTHYPHARCLFVCLFVSVCKQSYLCSGRHAHKCTHKHARCLFVPFHKQTYVQAHKATSRLTGRQAHKCTHYSMRTICFLALADLCTPPKLKQILSVFLWSSGFEGCEVHVSSLEMKNLPRCLIVIVFIIDK